MKPFRCRSADVIRGCLYPELVEFDMPRVVRNRSVDVRNDGDAGVEYRLGDRIVR